jgi:CRP-like cAMP-binding protein
VALRKDAKIELLERIPLFAQCSKRDLREIARVTEQIGREAGAIVIREGEKGHEFFAVVSGTLQIARLKPARVVDIGPGDFVGEMALLSNKPRNATVTATTPVHLLRISDRDFLALLDRIPLLWLKIAGALAERVADDDYVEG